MKKKYFLGLFILIFSCNKIILNENDHILNKRLLTEYKKDTIDFRKFKDFEWNSIIVLNTYCNLKRVEKENNINLSNLTFHPIQDIDFYQLIVFLKNNSAVKIIEFEKGIEPIERTITKNKCIFTKDENGHLIKINN